MKGSIFEYSDYKKYLVDLIDSHPRGSRGVRKSLAEASSSQMSHISNVLSGDSHLSPEQAEGAARFFGLNLSETEFLLLLIQQNRAGTQALRAIYNGLLDERRTKHLNFRSQIEMSDELKAKQENIYYSHWYYAAVHMLLMIPEFQSREAIGSKLNLAMDRVDSILSFLSEAGLIRKDGARWRVIRPAIHLEKTSPLVTKHHSNWRLKTMVDLDEKNDTHFHYSSVVSLSAKDYKTIRDVLVGALAKSIKVVKGSDDDIAAVICMDLYQL
jgi:uncharacterized protein (TIGR02147 family)